MVPEVALRCVASLLILQTQALRFPRQLGSKDDAGVFSSVAATFEVSCLETVSNLMLIKNNRGQLQVCCGKFSTRFSSMVVLTTA